MEMKLGKLNIGKLKKVRVGKATKFKKVKLDVTRIATLYKSGRPVSQIALAIGYPPNTGNNRVRNILIKAGLYKKTA